MDFSADGSMSLLKEYVGSETALTPDGFGTNVKLSDDGSILAVAAVLQDYMGYTSSGAVKVYDGSGSQIGDDLLLTDVIDAVEAANLHDDRSFL